MRRVATAVVAGIVAVAPAWADDSDWRPPLSLPTPAVPPPPDIPAVPAPAAPVPIAAAGEVPAWNPTRPDDPVWGPVGKPGPSGAPVLPPIPVPKLPSPPTQRVQQKTETIPPPRVIPPAPPALPAAQSMKPTTPPPSKLPEPRPMPTPTAPPPADCPPAKPALDAGDAGLLPVRTDAGVPIRHKTFGSPNITLSRDYHFLDLFGLGLIDDSDTVVLGEAPATDRYFVSAEYLLWWVNPMRIPALATTGLGQSLGYLGQPGTEQLLGPGSFGSSARNGFRVRAGAWLDGAAEGCGIDGGFFFLGRQTTTFGIDSTQFPTIARPIFAPNFNQEFGELVAFPGLATGALRVTADSFLWGADVNFRSCICRTCDTRSEWFAGYRHLNLQESLTISESLISGPNAPDPAGTLVQVQDSFRTRNQFHGGQVGFAVGRQRGRFDVSARVSVALGVTHEELDIAGSQVRRQPGAAPMAFNGGLLAAGPNLGSFDKDKFSVVPEATVNLGYMVTPNVRAFVGYNFLYWSNVIRPGDQIDRVVDLTFVPNAPPVPFSGVRRPLPTFRQSDLWAQGLQFGMELRW